MVIGTDIGHTFSATGVFYDIVMADANITAPITVQMNNHLKRRHHAALP